MAAAATVGGVVVDGGVGLYGIGVECDGGGVILVAVMGVGVMGDDASERGRKGLLLV